MKTHIKPVYKIYFDELTGIVNMEWNGYATSEQFRNGTELMLNELIKNSTTKVLAHIKHMVLIGSEDQKWLQDFFLPRAIQFGFRSLAIVKPDSYFNKVAVEAVSSNISKELTIAFFDDAESAQKWLLGK